MSFSRLSLLATAGLLVAGCGSDQNITDRAHCDGVLNSVEGTVDDAFDADGDGYFDSEDLECQENYEPEQLDCDDENAEINPGMLEVGCNDIDDDCNEATLDEGDGDEDGFNVCEGDCNDVDPEINPGADEVFCDGLDNDCDEATPDAEDADADGFDTCDDCDDENPDANPGTPEVQCNGADDDCNELTPDGDDVDTDGVNHCFDCDDNDPGRYPGNPEICEDGIDQNCDTVDDACPPPTWDGIWDTDAVFYSCIGAVIDFDRVSVVDQTPLISFTSVGSSQPGTMSGTITGNAFDTSLSISGLCVEEYELTGSFTDSNTFSATLTAGFIPVSAGLCGDCTNQSWSITGTR